MTEHAEDTVDDPGLAAFEAEAEAFLDAHALRRETKAFRWGEGSDAVSMFAVRDHDDEEREWAQARAFRRHCFEAGFGWIEGPPAYGGRGLPERYEHAWQRLRARYDVPTEDRFSIGLTYLAPTVLTYGTDEQKGRLLRPLFRADVVGCQLFSEPGAGSDLASVSTRAERDGDDWLVSGQKVWTTNAHHSDVAEILCRTDPAAPKHAGLTMFVLDMHAPGVEVRPLRQATGGTHFNEVFLDEVRVPDRDRLGGVGDGWRVAVTTLRNERKSIGSEELHLDAAADIDRLIELARTRGLSDDPIMRQRLAALHATTQASRWTARRAQARLDAGAEPGPELSIGKLLITASLLQVSDLVSHLLGARLAADAGEWGTFAWSEFVVGLPGFRISGGTDEIQRNVLAERVLGLPREPSPDRAPARS